MLSVIIPIYNTKPEHIKECLDSIVLLNELCEYEVIIINDGSTNTETCQYLQNIKNNHFKTKNLSILHQKNSGPSNARNHGIKFSKGDFIFPLDGDDVINDDIHYFIKFIQQNPTTDVVYGDMLNFGDINQYYKYHPFHNYELFFLRNAVLACSIFKKQLWEKVGGYDETFKTCEDWEFWCRCAINGAKFQYLPYANFKYRMVLDGLSLSQKTRHIMPEYHQKILDKLPIHINKNELQDFINTELCNQVKRKHKKAIALLIYVYCPRLFTWLCKKNIFKFGKNFFQM